MKTYHAHLINSIALILMPLWAYICFDATPEQESLSLTAMIPLVLGVILLLCYNGVKNQNKMIAHIAVLVTLIAVLGLFMPLKAAIADGRGASILRVCVMLVTGIWAMISFIKSFIAARRNK